MDRAPQALFTAQSVRYTRSFSLWRCSCHVVVLTRTLQALYATGLFESKELDFAALAASDEGITVMQPRGKRVGAQLPQM